LLDVIRPTSLEQVQEAEEPVEEALVDHRSVQDRPGRLTDHCVFHRRDERVAELVVDAAMHPDRAE
jgi:hypothetical protein